MQLLETELLLHVLLRILAFTCDEIELLLVLGPCLVASVKFLKWNLYTFKILNID